MDATKQKKLEAAGWRVGSADEFLEPTDSELTRTANVTDGRVNGSLFCSTCGRRDGGHDPDCMRGRRLERELLQAECDHRAEYGTIRTTGDPPGPPCCGRCGFHLRGGE